MKHLTDEQLAEWLAGESGEETRAHLQSCAHCNAEAINLSDGISRYSIALRQQAARAQSAQMTGTFTPGKALTRHRLRWAGATVLALLLAAQTAWMMKPRTLPQTTTQPIASAAHNPQSNSQLDWQPNSQPNSQPGAQMSDDELLEAVNNDLSRDVPQALAPISAITHARNQIADAKTGNESSKKKEN